MSVLELLRLALYVGGVLFWTTVWLGGLALLAIYWPAGRDDQVRR